MFYQINNSSSEVIVVPSVVNQSPNLSVVHNYFQIGGISVLNTTNIQPKLEKFNNDLLLLEHNYNAILEELVLPQRSSHLSLEACEEYFENLENIISQKTAQGGNEKLDMINKISYFSKNIDALDKLFQNTTNPSVVQDFQEMKGNFLDNLQSILTPKKPTHQKNQEITSTYTPN